MTVIELIAELQRHDPQDEVRLIDVDPDYDYGEMQRHESLQESHSTNEIIEVRRMYTNWQRSKLCVVLFKEGDT